MKSTVVTIEPLSLSRFARRQPKKGQTSPAAGSKADCGCQGSLKVAIPTVDASFGYFPVGH